RDTLLNGKTPVHQERKVEEKSDRRVQVNAPLDFELKDLDPNHDYLVSRGFRGDTMSYFGVGYCSRGLLKGRIAIPIHTGDGSLVGYAGRVADNRDIGEDNPRYAFPDERTRNGTTLRFDKSLLLYNAHRIKSPCDELIVVESFTATWWLHQLGFPDVVATMGTTCSAAQIDGILSLMERRGVVWLMPGGNEPGFRLGQRL